MDVPSAGISRMDASSAILTKRSPRTMMASSEVLSEQLSGVSELRACLIYSSFHIYIYIYI